MLNKTLMLLKSKYNIYNKRVVSLLLVFFMLLAFVPITAKAATTITVTYNANGGSGAPSAVNVTANSLFYISSTKPTRTGYTFQGWSKSSTATAVSYVSGSSVSFSANTTLYAVWKANTYTISYNANGGSGAPASQAKTYGITLTLSSTKPTRTGYTFQGWSTSSTATSATYSAGGSYTANASATLYAVWKANVITITVTYNANGGSGAPSAVNVTANSLFYISSTKPTRTGYTFQGWSKSSTATTVSYVSGSSVSFSASTTLYAVWKADTYTVSYNANGGSGAPASQAKTYGITLTLSSTKPTRTGYTFQGWSTSSTATSATYSAGGSYTANASATLYAVWKADAVTMGGAVSFDALSMFMMCKFPQGYNCRVFAFGSNEISVLNDSTKARKLSGINDSVASNEYRIALVDQSGSHAMRQTTNGWAEVSGNNTNDPHPCDTPSGNGYIYYAVKVVIHGNTPCSQCPNGTSCPKIQP